MPRAQSTDYYHLAKFQISESEGFLNTIAGFATCSTPEASIEVATYRDGINTYTKKQLGNPSFSTITMTRGVLKNDTNFWEYIRAAMEGQPVRTDFQVYHFHRDDVAGLLEYSNASPSRIIRMFNALPMRVKPSADFDGNSSDISMQEIEFEIERFEVNIP